MYFVSIDAGAQVAIILLTCGSCVVIGHCITCFVSGVGLLDIDEYSTG